ncbi:hypothetical protein [Paenibacillus ginsengihumi]|uniref:hypothetical protein n=1 Tax=Paenibacillus ginsengihumi TaxID=431596 RepID=UPI00035F9058|nr:hypothetical protein [Paenibacillus ginsengihumi]
MAAKIRAIEQTYLDLEERKTFKVWHPQVKFKGEWCFLPDDSSRTKLQEAPDEMTALEMAIKAVRDMETRIYADGIMR